MEGTSPWSAVSVPVMAPVGWSRSELLCGLVDLERVRREVEVAAAFVVAALGTGSRDAAAELARRLKISTRTARERVNVAQVVETVPGAPEALAAGVVSSDHLRVLARVKDAAEAAELLVLAPDQTPEEFARTVAKYELDRDSEGVRDRQQKARSVRFSTDDNGCIAMRAVFPPVEGNEFRTRLRQIADDVWRKTHPERAAVRGGHDDEPVDRRLLDALVEMMRGNSTQTGRPALIVVTNIDTMEAEIAGHGPIPFADIGPVAARAAVYGAIKDAKGAILNFGRSRRLASAIQRLAVIVRDGGYCAYPGCDVPWDRTECHHANPFENGGLTDLDNLADPCDPHHHHTHDNKLRFQRRASPANGPLGKWEVVPDNPNPSSDVLPDDPLPSREVVPDNPDDLTPSNENSDPVEDKTTEPTDQVSITEPASPDPGREPFSSGSHDSAGPASPPFVQPSNPEEPPTSHARIRSSHPPNVKSNAA